MAGSHIAYLRLIQRSTSIRQFKLGVVFCDVWVVYSVLRFFTVETVLVGWEFNALLWGVPAGGAGGGRDVVEV